VQNISNLTTRERIINATLDIISAEGFQNVTVRKIAEKADVNVAAVNYHFGSKDAVIDETLKQFTDKLIDCFRILESDENPQTKLHDFLFKYTSVIHQYPDIMRIFIINAIINYENEMMYAQFMKDKGFRLVKKTFMEWFPDEDDAQLSIRVLQFMGLAIFPFLIESKLKEASEFDYSFAEHREQYLKSVLERMI
jgi:AcrR family transcriptional regulator